MSGFSRLTIPVDQDTANRAATLLALLEAPGGADMRAGARALSVDTLERIHTAAANLAARTSALMAIAMGYEQSPTWEYVFEIINPGGSVDASTTVRWYAGDPAGARVAAIAALRTTGGGTFDPVYQRVGLEPVRTVEIS